MDNERKISVIMPVYNGQRYLERAVKSVLQQNYKNLEIVIINDGSTDKTAEIASGLSKADGRVKLITTPNGGPARARNVGLEAASGEYVNFLDVDDIFIGDKFRTQVAALEKNPEFGLAYSLYEILTEADGTTYTVDRGQPPLPFPEILSFRNWIGVMTPLIRRSVVEKVGPFDPSFQVAEDYDFWIRCAQVTQFLYVPGVFARYTIRDVVKGGTQLHKDKQKMDLGQIQLANKHFPRGKDRRSFLAYFNLDRARYNRFHGNMLGVVHRMLKYLYYSRSLSKARLVWRLAHYE